MNVAVREEAMGWLAEQAVILALGDAAAAELVYQLCRFVVYESCQLT